MPALFLGPAVRVPSVLLRLALRIDGRFVLAVIGLGAAMLVPVAGVLAAGGLTATIGKDTGYLVLPGPDGGDLANLLPSRGTPTWVLSAGDAGQGVQVAAFTKGPAVVTPTQAFDGGPAGRVLHVLGQELTTIHPAKAPVGPGFVLVHPLLFTAAANPAPNAATPTPPALTHTAVVAALYPSKVSAPGAQVQPARGADAFEAQGISDLRAGTVLLVLLSTPLVALVAAAFARLEAQRWSSLVGLGKGLGHPRVGLAVVILRLAFLAACGLAGCLVLAIAAAAAHLLPGGGSLSWRGLAFAAGVPAAAAALVGSFAAWRLSRDATASLGRSATMGDEPGVRWLPLGLRPLVAGWRLLGMLVLVGLLVGLDVGLPLAAAGSSAALAGQDGEWVIGARFAHITSGRADLRPAAVMRQDPAIDDLVAETYVPTLIAGRPVLLRGGSWEDISRYYGLDLVSGTPPANGTVVLGDQLARRLGVADGQPLLVAGEAGRVARLMVSGIFAGVRSSLLSDEGIMAGPDAASLAGLPPGTANVLRVRPQTEEALAAMHRGVASIQLADLRIDPPEAPAGSIATAILTASNLSGTAGTRAMQVRVNGAAVAQATVALGPYEMRAVRIPLRVPAGDFDVSINPEASGHGTEPKVRLIAPDHALAGTDLAVHLVGALGRIGLFASLDEAQARTGVLAIATVDSRGNATLPALGQGARVVATLQDPLVTAPVFVIGTADAGQARFVVEASYTVPPVPVAGQSTILSSRVRNVGGVAGNYTAIFSVDGVAIDHSDLHLGPGEAVTVSARYVPAKARAKLLVGGTPALDGGSRSNLSALPGSPSAPVVLPQGEGGASLQAAVANSLLGNSRAVLSGLALTAGTAALVLLRFGTRRVLGQRAGVVALMGTMWSAEHVQRRAAQEGAVLGALGGLVGLGLAKLVFFLLSLMSALHPFGHALPDPMTGLLVLQIVTLTGFLAATTLYATSGKSLAGRLG